MQQRTDNLNNLVLDKQLIQKLSFIGTVQKVFGVFGIIGGIFICLGIISAIFGIPMIIAGWKLFLSGRSFKQLVQTNDVCNIKEALINLAAYWLYTLIYLATIIIFYIIILFVIFIFGNNLYL
jgi:hypothetical protein